MEEQPKHYCTKRRMIVFVIFLGLLTVLLLILEEALTAQEHTPTPTPHTARESSNPEAGHLNQVASGKGESNSKNDDKYLGATQTSIPCWKIESFTVVEPCFPCTSFEISSGSTPACFETGLKEKVNCSTKGAVYRSCLRIPHVERTRFIVFESFMLLFTIVFYGLVKLRTSQLERITARQLEKRLFRNY